MKNLAKETVIHFYNFLLSLSKCGVSLFTCFLTLGFLVVKTIKFEFSYEIYI